MVFSKIHVFLIVSCKMDCLSKTNTYLQKQNPFSIDFHKTEECTLIQLSDENLMTLGESTKEVLSQIYE